MDVYFLLIVPHKLVMMVTEKEWRQTNNSKKKKKQKNKNAKTAGTETTKKHRKCYITNTNLRSR